MENNQILLIIAVVVGLYLLLPKNKEGYDHNKYPIHTGKYPAGKKTCDSLGEYGQICSYPFCNTDNNTASTMHSVNLTYKDATGQPKNVQGAWAVSHLLPC